MKVSATMLSLAEERTQLIEILHDFQADLKAADCPDLIAEFSERVQITSSEIVVVNAQIAIELQKLIEAEEQLELAL